MSDNEEARRLAWEITYTGRGLIRSALLGAGAVATSVAIASIYLLFN